MARRSRMSDTELAALCDSAINDAKTYAESDLASMREKALKYFEGHETLGGDAPFQDKRSRVVSRDLSDTHGWIMPGLLRVFLGSDKVAAYEPRRKEGEDGAKQATDYVNYVFLSECDGYRVLHASLWDGLNFGNGVVKHWWDANPVYTTESFRGLDEAAYLKVVTADDVEEVLEHSTRPDPDHVDVQPGPSVLGLGAPAGDGVAQSPSLVDGLGGQSGLGAADPAAVGMGTAGPPALAMGNQLPQDPTAPSQSPVGGDLAQPGILQPQAPEAPSSGLLHDFKIKRLVTNGRLMVKALPPEELLLAQSATALTEEDCGGFVAHKYITPRFKLIERGYDKEKVEDLPAYTAAVSDTEKEARDSFNLFRGSNDTADPAMDLIECFECYKLGDFDGKGLACWYKIDMAGGTDSRHILDKEEWGGDLPFTDLVPDPIPHRWRGRSLYEEVGDIQLIKTVLLRGALDNTYWNNNPQRWANKNLIEPASFDEIANPTFNGTAWTNADGNAAIGILPIPYIADKALMAFDKMDQIREFRTGVSAATMALDPEALSNQTATAVQAQQSAAYTKIETYARNIAEIGLKRLFKCLLKLISQNQDKPRTIRLRGKWVDFDARGWDSEMDVTINTGLGTGSRDRDIASLNAVLTEQKAIIMTLGPTNPIVPLDKYRETLAKLAETAGLKSPEQYFGEVTPEHMQALAQPQQPPPDPAMMKAQAQIEAQQMLMQAKQQAMQAEYGMKQQALLAKQRSDEQAAALQLKLSEQEAMAKHQLMQAEAAAELRLERERMQIESQNAREKAEMEAQHKYQLRVMEMQIEERLGRMQIAANAEASREQAAMTAATNIERPE